MSLLDNEKLYNVTGGSISGTTINAISRLITTVLDWGRIIGSAIYRYKNHNYCH